MPTYAAANNGSGLPLGRMTRGWGHPHEIQSCPVGLGRLGGTVARHISPGRIGRPGEPPSIPVRTTTPLPSTCRRPSSSATSRSRSPRTPVGPPPKSPSSRLTKSNDGRYPTTPTVDRAPRKPILSITTHHVCQHSVDDAFSHPKPPHNKVDHAFASASRSSACSCNADTATGRRSNRDCPRAL